MAEKARGPQTESSAADDNSPNSDANHREALERSSGTSADSFDPAWIARVINTEQSATIRGLADR